MNIELNGFLGGLALTMVTALGMGIYYAWVGGQRLWLRISDVRGAAQHGQAPESLGGLEHASDHGPA